MVPMSQQSALLDAESALDKRQLSVSSANGRKCYAQHLVMYGRAGLPRIALIRMLLAMLMTPATACVARDTSHVAFSKPRAGTVGHLFSNTSQKKVWKRCTTAAPANAFGNEPREAARKPPPNPRHWCVQHSSLHPSSDPRPLTARRHSAPATGHVKKRTQSHDLQFPDRSICSRCRWREISASGSERCDTT